MKSSAMFRGCAHDCNAAPERTKSIALVVLIASLALSMQSDRTRAHDLEMPDAEPARTIDIDGMSAWLRARFSATELERLRPEDFNLESHYCGCSDQPRKHFPYAVILLNTPKGDLIARPEPREVSVGFTALAVRYGTRYCALDSAEDCYGWFSDPCDFTDFRYGPSLAEFFPTCKSDEAEEVSAPTDETSLRP
jgi:hypothetical protein